jgi:hypothetical protein
MSMTREILLNLINPVIKINVEEFGEVNIVAMNLTEQVELEELQEQKDYSKVALMLIISCCVDDNGNKLFNKNDIELLKTKPARIINKLAKEIMKINRITQNDVEEIAKN